DDLVRIAQSHAGGAVDEQPVEADLAADAELDAVEVVVGVEVVRRGDRGAGQRGGAGPDVEGLVDVEPVAQVQVAEAAEHFEPAVAAAQDVPHQVRLGPVQIGGDAGGDAAAHPAEEALEHAGGHRDHVPR